MSFQEMYGSRGPWGQTAVLQLTYELRPKWNNNKNNKTLNAVSRSDPRSGFDKNCVKHGRQIYFTFSIEFDCITTNLTTQYKIFQ